MIHRINLEPGVFVEVRGGCKVCRVPQNPLIREGDYVGLLETLARSDRSDPDDPFDNGHTGRAILKRVEKVEVGGKITLASPPGGRKIGSPPGPQEGIYVNDEDVLERLSMVEGLCDPYNHQGSEVSLDEAIRV